MMDVKEKLVELIYRAHHNASCVIGYDGSEGEAIEEEARYLLAHGVTVQRWIPVTERLPSVKKIIDGETYFKNVAVRVKDCGFEKIAYYDDEEKCWFDPTFFPDVGEVTHWCELPEWNLPRPLKEE